MTSRDPSRPSYHIGTVAKLTGVSTHTIRVWERRYDAVAPARSPGGTREYSDADVTKLGLLKTLTDAGHSIGQIAHLDSDELRALAATTRQRWQAPGVETGPEAAGIAAFLAALEQIDIDAAERALANASRILGPLGVVFDVVSPIITEVGNRWASGELRIAHEHAATAALRNFLGSFLTTHVTRADAPVAAATTLSGELHELGAIMAAFVASVRGWRTVYLGPNLPVREIVHVVDTTGATLLLLSLVNARDAQTAVLLRELMAVLPRRVRVITGGRSANMYSDLLASEQRVGSLGGLYDVLGSSIAAPLLDGGGLSR